VADSNQAELVVRAMTRSPSDLDILAACFARNASPRDHAVFEWQYLSNPTGEMFVELAMAPALGRAAAVYATLPIRLRVGAQSLLGVQSVDTITDADFRGRGLFLQLARRTYDRAKLAGACGVYGFPNANSAHGFFTKLEWTKLDPIPFLIRPLRTKYVFERLKLPVARFLPDLPLYFGKPGKLAVEKLNHFDERVSRLWDAFIGNRHVAVERDARYLNWRLNKPGESYISEGIVVADEIVALVTHVVKAKHGGTIGYVMEAMCRPGSEAPLRALLARALANMTASHADVALAWCLPHSSTFSSYLRTGFLPFPERFRPIEIHYGARPFTTTSIDIANRDNWYLSYLDSDTT
jgi:hypothetical protein